MRTLLRHAATLATAVGLVAAAPAEARANGPADVVIVALGAGLVLADVGFTAYDVVVAAKRQPPSHGVAIAEAVVATPQALVSTIAFTWLVAEEPHPKPIMLIVLAAPLWTSSMSAHGIWAAASDRGRPELLPAVSLMIGADASLSAFALAEASRRRWSSRPFGIAEMLLTAPQLAVGIPAAVKSDGDRNAWIGAVAWSGTLFLHGLVSTIVGRPERDLPEPPEPPPPPEKPPLMVPASIQIAPGVIPGPLSAGFGVVMRGTLF